MSLLLPHLPRRDDLLQQTQRTWELVQAGKLDEALEAARAVVAACAAAQVESTHVQWVAAVAADRAGKLLDALRYIIKALVLDPLSGPAVHSLDIIAGRCRKALVDGTLDAEEGLALYRTLSETGLADEAVHLSYAKHLLDYEKASEALQVAQAVAVLNPGLAEAWRLVGAAATALGQKELAAEASLRCDAARADDGWNSLPRSAWGLA